MSSQYQKLFVLPPGFPALLKDFTRELLRAQPSNILEFGANYFAEKQRQACDDAPTIEPATIAEVEGGDELVSDPSDKAGIILDMFMSADRNHSGTLDRCELAAILRSADAGLSERQVRQMLSECDDNDDGVVEYREFVSLMMEILAADHAVESAVAESRKAVDDMRRDVEQFMLYGVPKGEMEAMMMRIFESADTDKSGELDRAEFKACLSAMELGLTRKDINLLMSSGDVNNDNLVSYTEFVPLCFGLLFERFVDQVLSSAALQSDDLLAKELLTRFQAADQHSVGHLPLHRAKLVLETFALNVFAMSQYQIHVLMSAAPEQSPGKVDYVQFAAIAASAIRKLMDAKRMKMRYAAAQSLAETEEFQDLSTLGAARLQELLREAFLAADVDESGTLTGREVSNALRELSASALGEELHLPPGVWQSMMAAVDADDDGKVVWSELVKFMANVFVQIERERLISDVEGQYV